LKSITNAQGLLNVDPADALDWHPQDNQVTPGVVAEYNVLYYHALRSAARLADALGKANEAAGFDSQAALVKTAVNADLFNTTMGLYDISEDVRNIPSQDVNALAVLHGVAPANERISILQNLKNDLYTSNGPVAFSLSSVYASFPVISPFISGFEAWARFEAGDATGALDLIRTVWGHMQKGSPFYSGGVWETLAPDATPKFGPGTSLAHPWSSGPTAGLSKYVLGVRPVSPGYKTWLIEPQPGDLTWAKGRVPTPYGPIKVKWEKTSWGLRLEIEVPNGTSGSVGLPTSSNADSLTDNGRPVRKLGKIVATSASDDISGARSGYAYLAGVGPGAHVIEVSGTKDD
jgi:alpha-L-rhamnosidase